MRQEIRYQKFVNYLDDKRKAKLAEAREKEIKKKKRRNRLSQIRKTRNVLKKQCHNNSKSSICLVYLKLLYRTSKIGAVKKVAFLAFLGKRTPSAWTN